MSYTVEVQLDMDDDTVEGALEKARVALDSVNPVSAMYPCRITAVFDENGERVDEFEGGRHGRTQAME